MKNYIKWLFGADSKEFETAMERMKRKAHDASVVIAKSITGIIGAAIAVTTKVIFDAISYFDNLQHKAEQLGQSVSFIAAFEAAFRQAGGSIQQADKAISDFSRKWGEAVAGSGELIAVLDTLNISTTNLDGTSRTAKEGMFLFADAINKTKDPAEKLFLATKAFGEEGGVKMIEVLDGGADSMARLIAQFELANPEIDQHAESLSEAKANLAALWDAILLFSGRFVGKIKEMFVTEPEIALANFKSFALEMLYGYFEAVGAIIEKMTFGRVKADTFLEEMRAKLDAAALERTQNAINAAEERKEQENAITQSIVEQSDAFKKQLEELAKLRKDEALRTGQVADRNKEIIHALIEQGLTLDTIVNRYPNLKLAIEASKTEYEKAAEAVAKLKENVDAATDATNKLADAAGNVNYPNPSKPQGGKPNLLADQGTYKKGGGVPGSFVGMNADLSSVSVSELLRMADELAEKKLKYTQSAGGIATPGGGMQLNEMYSKTIQNILDNINKELYYRAQEKAGASAGMVPKAGFSTPEQYFKRLDEFIEKLYEKENAKDVSIEKTVKTTEAASDATKKLANALDRFSGSLERSISRFGVSTRP